MTDPPTEATREKSAEPLQASGSTPAPDATTGIPATTATTSNAAQYTQEAAENILPASHWQAQEQPEDDDIDSAYEADNASSTASLTASILEYRTMHGRTYHSERGNAQSWNPNDALHEESMDLLDFADQYPGAEVIGVDISPPQAHWLPPNLKFEVDDMTDAWTYAPDSFDYVHIRWLVGAIPDWNELFQQAYKTLKPGGYLESKESSALLRSDDGTVPVGSALDQWGRVFWEAGKKFGRSFRVLEDDVQRKAMEAAGFVDIKEYVKKASAGSSRPLHP
ncbi:hypothetical protein DL766_002976 [Monosporascus sp. MC13-8B]|uniref:Methyltransferase domain-containing protein n=1 Tax=Monosporascus cannonballus TaxID=155416 RepID=A0ABY0HIC1_9PEZI|nr:hypothetical protein DL763_005873 [Monosporascus cannonballus]RYO93738.1 hypothetical protein DL762_000943 [Monosporascus cannonballus]RYP34455.1 hypothetical protein DL766_002976 [Monosporascus sp. MC13-8B]